MVGNSPIKVCERVGNLLFKSLNGPSMKKFRKNTPCGYTILKVPRKKSSCFSDSSQFLLVGMLSGYHFSMGDIQR